MRREREAEPTLEAGSTRAAVVTGAGSDAGIGFAAARRLAADGTRIVVTATTDRVLARADELRAGGAEAIGVVADLTRAEGAERVIGAAVEAFGRVDVLVNNAGMTSVSDPDDPAAIDELTLARWHASLERNLTTAFLMTQAAIAHMRAAGYGRIVNVSSVSGPVQAFAGDVAYHAAKAGMLGLTRSVALDAATAGITVNAVAPGWIATASSSERELSMGRATPLGRPGTPDEVAHVIAFLASEGASYLTGQLITVDGANSIDEERALSGKRPPR